MLLYLTDEIIVASLYFFKEILIGDYMHSSFSFSARLYGSTGRAIALPPASALTAASALNKNV